MTKIQGTPLEVKTQLLDYINSKQDKEKLYCYIGEKETKIIRSLQQNSTFWKLFTDIGNHLGETKEDVHDVMLAGVFGTRLIKIGLIEKEVNVEKNTSKLTKEQGIKFIDTILLFTKKYNMPITITSREINSLYDSYSE